MNITSTLIQNCIQGDRQSQKELYDLLSPRMFSICLKFFKNRSDAEDVLQEGFICLFTKLHQFKGEGSFEGWVKRIFVNTSISYLRTQKPEPLSVSELEEFIASKQKNALDNLYEKDILQITRALSNGYKTVFNLYAVEGYSHKEVADLLGITESTSKSQYLRAKASIRSSILIKKTA
jgi:RNA polymerase sigma-70 factor (ECF subfamily)